MLMHLRDTGKRYTGLVSVVAAALIFVVVPVLLAFTTFYINDTLRENVGFLVAQADDKFKSRILAYSKLIKFFSFLLLVAINAVITSFVQVLRCVPASL